MLQKNKLSFNIIPFLTITFCNLLSINKVESKELKIDYKNTNPWKVLDEKTPFLMASVWDPS